MAINKDIKKAAIFTAKEAGKTLVKRYKDFDRAKIRLKSRREIVTRWDLFSEEIIIKNIKKNFPAHQILSEEIGKIEAASDYLWIIDPIDGTTNFSIHNPLWSISIGVAYKKELVMGVVYAPCLDELYWAEKGRGAFLNGKSIKVSNVKDGKVINTFCHGSKDKDIKKMLKYFSRQKLYGFDCRQLGSASIELAYVAAGRTESIVIPGTKPWDVAGGVMLVREAGGLVTDFSGQEWTIEDPDIVATNGLVHRNVLAVVNK